MKTQVVAALLLLGFALLDTDHAFANASLGQIGKSVGKGILKSAPGWAVRNDREDSEDQDVRQRSEGYPRNHPNRFPHDGRSDSPIHMIVERCGGNSKSLSVRGTAPAMLIRTGGP